MFSPAEETLLEKLRDNPVGYPFSLSKEELKTVFHAINRERGDSEMQERRHIRTWLALKLKWHFAMDGGFMPNQGETGYSEKYWQDSAWPFSKIYLILENLILHLLGEGWNIQQVEKVVDSIMADSSCIMNKFFLGGK